MDYLLTSSQVAKMLRVHPSTLSRLRSVGGGPPVVWVTDNSPRYLLADVRTWLASRKAGR